MSTMAGIIRSAREAPPGITVSPTGWYTPYLRGITTSLSHDPRPPTAIVQMTTVAPLKAFLRSVCALILSRAPDWATILRHSPSATASASGEMSTSATSPRQPRKIMSATMPRVKTALPAPTSTTFASIVRLPFCVHRQR